VPKVHVTCQTARFRAGNARAQLRLACCHAPAVSTMTKPGSRLCRLSRICVLAAALRRGAWPVHTVATNSITVVSTRGSAGENETPGARLSTHKPGDRLPNSATTARTVARPSLPTLAVAWGNVANWAPSRHECWPVDRVQLQRVAHVVKADAVGELGVGLAHQMAPRRERRDLSSAPVARATLATRYCGIRLHTWCSC